MIACTIFERDDNRMDSKIIEFPKRGSSCSRDSDIYLFVYFPKSFLSDKIMCYDVWKWFKSLSKMHIFISEHYLEIYIWKVRKYIEHCFKYTSGSLTPSYHHHTEAFIFCYLDIIYIVNHLRIENLSYEDVFFPIDISIGKGVKYLCSDF